MQFLPDESNCKFGGQLQINEPCVFTLNENLKNNKIFFHSFHYFFTKNHVFRIYQETFCIHLYLHIDHQILMKNLLDIEKYQVRPL